MRWRRPSRLHLAACGDVVNEAFSIAAKQIGLTETGQKAALQEYLSNGGQNLDPAVTSWCAAFVNATLAQSGGQGTGKLNARSFLDWGEAVDQPQRGDVAVFSRGDPSGWQGHVGFFEGYDADGNIRVLGGNQGDAVNVSSYGADRLLGFRRASGGQPQPGNALASPGMSQPQRPQGQPQQPQRPEFQMADTRLDPRAFMSTPNVLAPMPLQRVTGNVLGRV